MLDLSVIAFFAEIRQILGICFRLSYFLLKILTQHPTLDCSMTETALEHLPNFKLASTIQIFQPSNSVSSRITSGSFPVALGYG